MCRFDGSRVTLLQGWLLRRHLLEDLAQASSGLAVWRTVSYRRNHEIARSDLILQRFICWQP